MEPAVRGARIEPAIIAARLETAFFASPDSEFPNRQNAFCRSEPVPPGTEFLDAETGRKKSPPETGNVRRDRKAGMKPSKIPPEAARFQSMTVFAF
jgi:hypothetical protein